MPKWIKFIIAVLLLPVCAGAARALWLVLRAGYGADTVWVPLFAGAACWIVIFFLLPKPMWIYVLGHELTHALWTWLFGGEVKKMKVRRPAAMSSSPRQISSSRSRRIFSRSMPSSSSACLRWQFHLELAGYLVWFHLLVGAAYAFHVTLTGPCFADAAVGHHVAGLFIFRRGDFSRQRLRAAVWDSAADAASEIFEFARPVVRRDGEDFPLAAPVDLKPPKMSVIQS